MISISLLSVEKYLQCRREHKLAEVRKLILYFYSPNITAFCIEWILKNILQIKFFAKIYICLKTKREF